MSAPGDGWTQHQVLPFQTSPRRVRIAGDDEKVSLLSKKASPAPLENNSTNKKGEAPTQQQTLNTSTNVILLFRLHNLQTMSNANFTFATLSLLYAAMNCVLLVLNYADRNDDDCGDPRDISIARCGSATSDLIFHRTEFWATFCFALVTAFSLMYTPKAASNIYDRPLLLKLMLLVEICCAAIPAALVTVNLEIYEVWSHELEYLNEITLSFVDVVLLSSLLRLDDDDLFDDDDDDLEEDLENNNFSQQHHNAVRRRSSIASATLRSIRSNLSDVTTRPKRDSDNTDNSDDDETEGRRGTIDDDDDDDTIEEEEDESSSMKPLGIDDDDDDARKTKPSFVSRLKTTGFFPPQQDDDTGFFQPPSRLSSLDTSVGQGKRNSNGVCAGNAIVPTMAAGVACLQLIIYNAPASLLANSEKTAHYFEFTFGILSSLVTFWFCMDNRFEAESEIMLILYGNHRDCLNCRCAQQAQQQQQHQNTQSLRRRKSTFATSIRRKLARTFSTVSNLPDRRLSIMSNASRRPSVFDNNLQHSQVGRASASYYGGVGAS